MIRQRHFLSGEGLGSSTLCVPCWRGTRKLAKCGELADLQGVIVTLRGLYKGSCGLLIPGQGLDGEHRHILEHYPLERKDGALPVNY